MLTPTFDECQQPGTSINNPVRINKSGVKETEEEARKICPFFPARWSIW